MISYKIWDLADPIGKGYLDRQSFYITLKLISLAQSMIEPKIEKLNLTTAAPKLVSFKLENKCIQLNVIN